MANLSPGMSFTVNDFLTAARLHALIDTAIAAADGYPGLPALFNVDSPSCASGVRVIATSTPTSPAAGDLMVGSDGLLDYYSGSAWVDPEPNYIALQNNSGRTLATGTPVVMDVTSPSAFKIHGTANVSPDPFGVTLAQVNPLATCNVAFRGKVLMKVNNKNNAAGGYVVINGLSTNGIVYDAGQAQYGQVPTIVQSGLSDIMAVALEPGSSSGFGLYAVQQVLLLK